MARTSLNTPVARLRIPDARRSTALHGRRRRALTCRVVVVIAAALLLSHVAYAQQLLASGALRILGARLEVQAPADVPIDTPFTLPTALIDGDGHAIVADTLFTAGSVLVRGELSRPGLTESAGATLPVGPVPAGSPLPIPALTRAGNYVVDHLRLTDAQGIEIFPAAPSVLSIKALEQILVTSVSSRPLSLDEIQDRGIVLDPNNYTAFEFTFGIATESNPVPISLAVAFPQDQAALPTGGAGLDLAVTVPGLNISRGWSRHNLGKCMLPKCLKKCLTAPQNSE